MLKYQVIYTNPNDNNIVFYGNDFGRSQLMQYNLNERTLVASFTNNKKGSLGKNEILGYQVANTKCKHEFK